MSLLLLSFGQGFLFILEPGLERVFRFSDIKFQSILQFKLSKALGMAGVADSSYCSLPMSKFSSSSTPEKVTFNLRPCSFVEMVGVYVGCVKYFPTCSFARSFQDNKKYKNLIIAASSSQQTVHVQGDNQVSLEFKRLSRVGEVNAALQVMDKMEKNRVFLGSVDIVELLKCCIDLKLLEAGKRFMSMFCGLSQNPVRLCLINWWRCTVDWVILEVPKECLSRCAKKIWILGI